MNHANESVLNVSRRETKLSVSILADLGILGVKMPLLTIPRIIGIYVHFVYDD